MLTWAGIFAGSTSTWGETLNLTVGQRKDISIDPNEVAHVHGNSVISVEDKGNHVEVVGRTPGHAVLKIASRDFQFFVNGASHASLFAALKEASRNLLGLNVTMNGNQIVVSGELHRLSDWQLLAQTAQSYGGEYTFRGRLDDDIKPQVLKFLRENVYAKNLPAPNFLFSPESRAIIADEFKNLAPQWDEILAPFGIARVYEKSALAIQPLVRVNIVVAEVNKAASQQLGVEWPDSASAQISPAFNGQAQVMLTLHALERAGLGSILASPNLLARSGSEAEFLAGGELPIKVANHYVHEVVWKRHGIYLKIKPIADFSGKVSIELTTEVSMPDKVYDELPSLKSNRISTHFDLAEPRTIVLSGLIRNNWDESSEGLPLLSRLPIIGRLFSSKNFTSSRSELVIFVTPQIVNVHDESQDIKMPKDWKKHDESN